MDKISFGIFCLFCILYVNTFSYATRYKRQFNQCGSSEFRCSNGQCIEQFSVCDGKKNCADGTDETQAICTKLGVVCPGYAFRCAYGACVDRSAKCNGQQDCADNSDELLPDCLNKTHISPSRNTKCKERQFMCVSGQCVDDFSVCDGNRDCEDSSDETITQCVNIRCPAYSFQCAYGACIDKSKKCNNVNDCSDGSDEDEELCQSHDRPRPHAPTRPKPLPRPTVSPGITGGCPLPEKPDDGNYIVHGCTPDDSSSKCRGIPGAMVPLTAVLSYSCNKGFVLSDKSKNIFCLEGKWEPEPLTCLKLCKALMSDSMDLKCFYKGEEVPCSQPNKPGTKLRPKCRSPYRPRDPEASFIETECLSDGTWEQPLFKCVAECGIQSPNNEQTLISKGESTKVGEYPWHAGLYSQQPNFELFCGGTIISPYAVLTAAHCIYDENLKRVKNPKTIMVAIGKYRRDWNLKDSFEQRIPVKDIIPQKAYRGKSNSYEQDIAVIELLSSIKLSNVVLPVCINWAKERHFNNGELGTVVGWGLDENKVLTDVLKAAKLPFFDWETCTVKAPPDFSRYITYDKFCADYKNGTGVQQGDSGGGFTFTRNGVHFIYGIVSLKQKYRDTFALFTNVTEHLDWLERVLKAVNAVHKN